MTPHEEIVRLRRKATVAFAALVLGLGFALSQDGRRAADSRDAIVQSTIVTGVANCNRDFRGRVEVLSVLRGSRAFARLQFKNGNISRVTFEAGDKFYAERLKGLSLPDCRLIEKTITSNASTLDKIKEKPLYPGSPGTKGTGNSGRGGQDPGTRPQPGGGGG